MLTKKIVGQGGKNITTGLDLLHAVDPNGKIVISRKDDNGDEFPYDALDRVLIIRTTRKGLSVALKHMIPSLQFQELPEYRLEVRMMVPSHCMASVMGKGGNVINDLCKETGSLINPFKTPLPNADEIVLSVKHYELDALAETIMKITQLVNVKKEMMPISR